MGLGNPLSCPQKIGPPWDTPWYKETSWLRFGCVGSTRLGGVNGHKNVTDKQRDKDTSCKFIIGYIYIYICIYI